MSFLQDIVAGEYHLDVLGINLQGGRKNVKKKNCVSPPQEKGGRKNRNFGTVPGTRGQGTGTSWVSYQPDPTKIDPDPASSVAQIRPRWPKMLRSRFWLQKKDLGASVGAICIIFRDLSGRSRPDSKKLKILLRFLSCPFIKGTPVENSYIPYNRLGPILCIYWCRVSYCSTDQFPRIIKVRSD